MAGQRLGQSQEPAGKPHHRAQAGSGQTHRLCPEDQLDHRPDDPATVLRGSRPARPLHAAGTERSAAATLRLFGSSTSSVRCPQQAAPLPAGVPPAAGLAQAGSGAGHPGSTRHPVLGPRPGPGRRGGLRLEHHQQPGAKPPEEGADRDPERAREPGALLPAPLPALHGGQARHRRGHRPQAGAGGPHPLQPPTAGRHRTQVAEPQPAVQATAGFERDPAGHRGGGQTGRDQPGEGAKACPRLHGRDRLQFFLSVDPPRGEFPRLAVEQALSRPLGQRSRAGASARPGRA